MTQRKPRVRPQLHVLQRGQTFLLAYCSLVSYVRENVHPITAERPTTLGIGSAIANDIVYSCGAIDKSRNQSFVDLTTQQSGSNA
jgi:hypothetical protein